MANDPIFLLSKVRTAIKGISHLPEGSIYDGYVPDKVAEDANGFVKPYVAIYAGIGGDSPEERSLSKLVDLEDLNWSFQTTCVAATHDDCLRLTHQVRLALTNLPVLGGFVKPDGFNIMQPLLDDQVTPARFFLPPQWRLIT